MKCARVHKILVDYSEATLGDVKRRAVESHLSDCEACGAELGRIEALKQSVRSLDAPERDAEFWSRFDDKLSRRLAQSEEGSAAFVYRPRRRALVPLAAAAAAAMIIASLMIFGGGDDNNISPGITTVAIVSPEAVEGAAVPGGVEIDEIEFALSEFESVDDEMLDEILLAQADLSDGNVDWDGDDMLSLIAEDLLAISDEVILDGIFDQSVDDYLEDMSEEEFEEMYAGLASI